MAKSKISPQIALNIIDHIRLNNLRTDDHLGEKLLADLFRVSRGPVNAALKVLEQMDVVRSEPNRGFFVRRGAEELQGFQLPPTEEESDDIYFTIAEDRLSGKLPDRVSESELMRLYDLPRGRLLKILSRIAEDRWIERLPGHGWEFLPTLTSPEAYAEGYRFRAVIEPAALREPTFRIDPVAIRSARTQQMALLNGDLLRLSRTQLFKINSEFHEMLVGFSGNQFFLDAVKRVNRVRRLMEYRVTLNRSRLPQQTREHIAILERLESGDIEGAAEFLEMHIRQAWQVKSSATGSGANAPLEENSRKVRTSKPAIGQSSPNGAVKASQSMGHGAEMGAE
jgi:DNA-binding GntR family transcriptional regulator